MYVRALSGSSVSLGRTDVQLAIDRSTHPAGITSTRLNRLARLGHRSDSFLAVSDSRQGEKLPEAVPVTCSCDYGMFPLKVESIQKSRSTAKDAPMVAHIDPIFKLATPCSSFTRTGADTPNHPGEANEL